MAKEDTQEKLVAIQTEGDSTYKLARDFIEQHFGKIDSDIEVKSIRHNAWDYRSKRMDGIQFSTGYYGHKTIKRVMVKGSQISLTKLQNAIAELTKVAKDNRDFHEKSVEYIKNLDKAKMNFLIRLHTIGFKQEDHYSNPKSGKIEIELKHADLHDNLLSAYLNIEIEGKLSETEMLKVAEYLKGINEIIKHKEQS